MKVLHIISSGGMYGAEAVILDLSRSLNRSGHQSEIAVFVNSAQPNTELAERARAEGLEVHEIRCRGQLDVSVPSLLREVVARRGADLVHAHGYKADVYGYLALRSTRTPLVSTCHNWLDTDLAVRVYGALDRWVLRRFPGVVAVSEQVRQRLVSSGVEPRRIRLIKNGVDLLGYAATSPRRPQGQPGLTVGVVARLSEEKGVDIFLRAAALAAQSVPGTRFLVAGEGPERPALGAMIQDLQLEGRATLLGRQEDMAGFYSKLAVLVLPSRKEGLPMALLEGMACGLAVVASAVGEVPLVVRDGMSGVLFEPGDHVALAAAIVDLLQHPEKREQMGTAARSDVAAQFSSDRMAAEYVELYMQVCAEGGDSACEPAPAAGGQR